MKRRLRYSRRTRLRLTLLVLLSLLSQQVALASYVCNAADIRAGTATMMAHCDTMPMAPARNARALCTLHCAQLSTVTQGVHAPSVPALPFAALLPSPPLLAALPTAHAMHAHAALWRAPGIPPKFRVRVLLI
ncbi:MAG: hypothetical protein WBV39_13310 [Rudaea sp.]